MKIEIYTDGACSGNPGPGGCATIVLRDDGIIKIATNCKMTTNNRMELQAVINAMEYINKHGIEKNVYIYSDSAYVINAINQEWIKKWIERRWRTQKDEEVKNKDLWIQLHDHIKKCKTKNLRFIKVKGHANDTYNEMADKLAKEQVLKAIAT